jgi:hypothetical protein
VDYYLTKQPEASDVVHDLLAFLAEEMLRLNKEKQALQKSFLNTLVETLYIQSQPDKDGKVGIEALKNKSQILNYPGDYQKGDEPLKWEALCTILRANKNRYQVHNMESLLPRIEEIYAQNLAQVLPIKDQLQRTDWLIDQVVYRLYGLTEDEQRIVEGRV